MHRIYSVNGYATSINIHPPVHILITLLASYFDFNSLRDLHLVITSNYHTAHLGSSWPRGFTRKTLARVHLTV
jgi:hypothetical protein